MSMPPPPYGSDPVVAAGDSALLAEPVALGYANAEIPYDPGNPWFAIWRHPTAVMKWVLATDPKKDVPLLIVLGAVANGLSQSGDRPATLMELAIQVVAGATIGAAVTALVTYFVVPWLLKIVGGWLGGTGDMIRLRAAVAYAQIPNIWAAIFSIIVLLILAVAIASGGSDALLVLLLPIGLAIFVVAVWSLCVFVACVAVAHRFSKWLSLATCVLAGLVVVGIVMLALLPFLVLLR